MLEWPVWLTNLASIGFGLVVGSFLNVVIVRLPRRQSLARPRSSCPGCGGLIRWFDNLPVLSYLMLRGRCRRCRTKIPLRYPVVELLTTILFLAARLKFGWNPALLVRDWPFVSILVAVTFIDLEHRIIPDPLSLGGLAWGLGTSWLTPDPGIQGAFAGAAIGFGVFYALAWGYYRITGRSGLGGGDIKLLALLGAFLGPTGVLYAIFISSVFGSVVGIGWALATGKKNVLGVSIPYGPFLVVGGLYYYLLNDLIWFRFMTPT